MATYSVYCKYMFPYDFSLGDAYVQTNGFSHAMDTNTFQFTYHEDINKASVVIFIRDIPDDSRIHLTVLDPSGQVIPGSEEFVMDGPSMKSIYTPTNIIKAGTPMKFRVSSNLSSSRLVEMCAVLITC